MRTGGHGGLLIRATQVHMYVNFQRVRAWEPLHARKVIPNNKGTRGPKTASGPAGVLRLIIPVDSALD